MYIINISLSNILVIIHAEHLKQKVHIVIFITNQIQQKDFQHLLLYLL